MSYLPFDKENINNSAPQSSSVFDIEKYHPDFHFSQYSNNTMSYTELNGNKLICRSMSNNFEDKDCFNRENETYSPGIEKDDSAMQISPFKSPTTSIHKSHFSRSTSDISDVDRNYDRYSSPYRSTRTKRFSSYNSHLNSDMSEYYNDKTRKLTHSEGRSIPKPLQSETTNNLVRSQSDVCERIIRLRPKPIIGNNTSQRRRVKKKTLLPCYKIGQYKDRYIDGNTLFQLLKGEFSEGVDEFCIIDCRFGYEFCGGHIRGALNFETPDAMVNRFFSQEIIDGNTTFASTVIIFHCEFSIKRGPTSYRLFREHDRNVNTWPKLFYPEVYLLEGGYANFFEKYKDFCSPCGYTPMKDKKFKCVLNSLRDNKRSKSMSSLFPVNIRRSSSSITLCGRELSDTI